LILANRQNWLTLVKKGISGIFKKRGTGRIIVLEIFIPMDNWGICSTKIIGYKFAVGRSDKQKTYEKIIDH
jgi:hypothetical protein